jgi:predicted nicotinamide N-methyase
MSGRCASSGTLRRWTFHRRPSSSPSSSVAVCNCDCKPYRRSERCRWLEIIVEEPSFVASDVGSLTWPAAATLSRLLVSETLGSLIGCNVLELGSGTGVVGLTCLKLGARSVVMSDFNDGVLDNLKRNLTHNGFTMCNEGCTTATAAATTTTTTTTTTHSQCSSIEFLDWKKVDCCSRWCLNGDIAQIDWIVAADVVYEESHSETVSNMMATLFKAATKRQRYRGPLHAALMIACRSKSNSFQTYVADFHRQLLREQSSSSFTLELYTVMRDSQQLILTPELLLMPDVEEVEAFLFILKQL